MAAVGTIVVTAADIGGGITKYSIVWTSDAAGAVSGTALAVRRGHLNAVKFIPAAAASQPSDQYSAQLQDGDSADLLGGTGAALSNANAKADAPVPFFEGGNLTPVVAAAGNAKSGTIILYVGP